MEKLSYALGMVIGHNLKSMNVTNLNAADFAAAVSDVLEGKNTNINDAEAQQIVSTFIEAGSMVTVMQFFFPRMTSLANFWISAEVRVL